MRLKKNGREMQSQVASNYDEVQKRKHSANTQTRAQICQSQEGLRAKRTA